MTHDAFQENGTVMSRGNSQGINKSPIKESGLAMSMNNPQGAPTVVMQDKSCKDKKGFKEPSDKKRTIIKLALYIIKNICIISLIFFSGFFIRMFFSYCSSVNVFEEYTTIIYIFFT